jgi:uncharacterized protein YggE
MKNFILIISFISFFVTSFAQTTEKNFIDQNYIEVTGTAETEIIPNEIEITISVNDKDFKTKQAFTDFEQQVISKLKEIGVSVETDFSVMNMNSSLKVSIIGKNNMFSTRQYKVVVHDASKANEVFTEMEKIGISTIAITRFDHSDIEKYKIQIKTNAIKAAKDKANILTSAIGQSIGRALYINELTNRLYNPNISANVAYNELLKSDLGQVERVNFQKIKLNYSVMVRFELK